VFNLETTRGYEQCSLSMSSRPITLSLNDAGKLVPNTKSGRQPTTNGRN
jgi:hypothetical protein